MQIGNIQLKRFKTESQNAGPLKSTSINSSHKLILRQTISGTNNTKQITRLQACEALAFTKHYFSWKYFLLYNQRQVKIRGCTDQCISRLLFKQNTKMWWILLKILFFQSKMALVESMRNETALFFTLN